VARQLKHETRIFLLTLCSGLPAVLLGLVLLAQSDLASATRGLFAVFIVLSWWGLAWVVRERVVRPLQTASNLLSALREEDFSVRARSGRRDDALGGLMLEINTLSQTLREQRLGALEASALLRTVMFEIDVAIFAFDEDHGLKLANRAGERLLARPAEQLFGRSARELGLGDWLADEPARTASVNLPGGTGRWGIRRGSFRLEGRPHQLLVMTDLSRALRDEERQAWQRLVRVIGHELNNSLAPIKSLAGTMNSMLAKSPRPADWEADLQAGLGIIGTRADSLSRFMDAYARLARLPPPRRRPLQVAEWVRNVTALETRLKIAIQSGPETTLRADGDQLEQLLINLVRNAVDAVMESGRSEPAGQVEVGWRKTSPDILEVWVSDNGPGLSDSANLFVPFFTTKPAGTGIGLALCRQIAEGHDGTLTLENRSGAEGPGCVARLRLPI
jgi:two-component system nitrogen regulation sensor histidine kinase NtrY